MKNLSRKLNIRAFSLIITSVFIVLVVLFNVFASMLTERFFLKADLTETGLFTMSEEAAEFLESVDETVDIVVLADESVWKANSMFNLVINTLQNYSAATGGRLRVQYVNPDLNYFNGPEYNNSLTFLKEAHADLDNMTHNDIIFISSRRAALVPATELFLSNVTQDGRPFIAAVRTDQLLVSALLHVLNENVPHAVFIQNHEESPSDYIRFILSRSGYVYSEINLAIDEIPEDTTVLFTVAPKFDFISDEIIKLENYLAAGGNAIVLYDFDVIELPVLDAFLAEWGIMVENKLIFDDVHTYIQQYGIIGAHVVAGHLPSSIESEEYTRETMRIGAYLARPLRSTWVGDAMSGFTQFPLIQTFSDSSYAKSLEPGASTTTEREPGDDSGPFVIAYNISRVVRGPDNQWMTSNLIVTGADMFDDAFLGMFGNTFYNAIFIANLADDFNPGGQNVFISAKPLANNQMPVSSGNARMVIIVMVIALPALIYATAVLVWYKRRHK
ncbi:MAG: GldG family protein [Oscillospiraceae bacterium]|nr:GldG family protein [Oscillospiraceae bacterium]